MPSGEIMQDYREGHLHSGRGGKIVRNRKQAIAIYLSYKRKEGKIGPRKKPKSKSAGRRKHAIIKT
jgi:Family of unknown function (DUF6496)